MELQPQYVELAEGLAAAVAIGSGDNVFLSFDVEVPHDMRLALINAVKVRGGVLLGAHLSDSRLSAAMVPLFTERTMEISRDSRLTLIQAADVYITLTGGNPFEMGVVPDEVATLQRRVYSQPLVAVMLQKRWLLTTWPTQALATLAGMGQSEMEDFYFKAVLVDYDTMARRLVPLRERMEQTDRVRIVGPETDLRFSIKGIGAVVCAGDRNRPDGEIFSSPVKGSMEGTILFNAPIVTRDGTRFSGIHLTFEAGRVVGARCASGNQSRLDAMLDTDEGSHAVGEFAIGVNWMIDRPIGNTLFDEKIGGTVHLALGQSLPDADNGNKSALHQDMVHDQRKPAGGGELWLDNELVRKDGLFLPDELAALNS